MDKLSTKIHLVGYSKHSLPFFYSEQRHGLNVYLFRLQTEGKARALVGGQMTDITPGDLLLYKPGDPYELQIEPAPHGGGDASSTSCDFYVYCSGTWVDDWWARSPKPQKVKIPLDHSLIAVWWEFAREQIRTDDFTDDIMEHFLKTLCLKIQRVLVNWDADRSTKHAFVSYRMRNYIVENIAQPITVRDVARYVSLSESRAAHLFKESFGVSIIQYILDIRLKLVVQRMMFESSPLEVIAENCGFRSYSYFHRQFRARYAQSPQEYRLHHR